MKHTARFVVAICFFLTVATYSHAQPPEPVLLQTWDGFSVSEFTIADGYAWGLGGAYQDPELYRLDLTGDGDGEFVLDLPARCTGLDAENGLLILTAGWEGLYLIDISDPLNPVWLSTFHMPGEPQDVVIRDGIAYVACSYSGLVTVDVTNSALPEITQYYMAGEADPLDQVAIHDDVLVATARSYGFISFSVTDPTHPAPLDTLLANHGSDSGLSNLNLSADRLSQPYVVWGDDGWNFYTGFLLQIATLQDGYFGELAEHDFGSTTGGGSASAALQGQTLVASMFNDTGVYDITDPADLDPYYFYPDSTLGYMLIEGDFLYARSGTGMNLFSLNGPLARPGWPAHPDPALRSHSTTQSPARVATDHSLEKRSTGRVMDTEDWDITELNSLQLDPDFGVDDMLYHNGALYLIAHAGQYLEQIRVVDARNPYHLQDAGSVPALSGTNYDMTITGDTMIVAVSAGLKLFDLSDPVDPTYMDLIALDDTLDHIAAHGNRVFGYNDTRLLSLDISDPDNPIQVDALHTGPFERAAVSPDGHWLLLASTYSYADRPYDFQVFGRAELFALGWIGDRPYKVKQWENGDGDYYTIKRIGLTNTQLQTSYSLSSPDEWWAGASLIWDFSEPFYPFVLLNDYRTFVSAPSRAAWHEEYLLYSMAGLVIHDISDPQNPELLLQDSTVVSRNTCLDWPFYFATSGSVLTAYQLDSTTVDEPDDSSPGSLSDFAIHSIYPNPFNPEATITIDMPVAGTAKVTVYDILGREIRTLTNRRYGAGRHALAFNGANLPSGLYFARLDVADFTETHKMVMLK
ncbi:T9SS type A sorting domain-containing protein [bacterium]|nr:T9SS type A sorting domain-containing protein [bacterium]